VADLGNTFKTVPTKLASSLSIENSSIFQSKVSRNQHRSVAYLPKCKEHNALDADELG